MSKQFNLAADGLAGPYVSDGALHVKLKGDFGGGTAQLQALDPDETTWSDVIGGSFTAETDTVFDYPEQGQYQIDLSGATLPDLDVIFTG